MGRNERLDDCDGGFEGVSAGWWYVRVVRGQTEGVCWVGKAPVLRLAAPLRMRPGVPESAEECRSSVTTANCRPAPAREGAAVSPNGCYFALVKSTWQRQPMRIFLVALHANNPHCEPCRRSAVHFKFSQNQPVWTLL